MLQQIYFSIACLLFYVIYKLMDSEQNKIKYYFKLCTFYMYSLIVTSLIFPYVLWKGRNVENALIATKYLRPMEKFFGLNFHLENGEYLNLEGSAVIIANHQTALDLLGMFFIWEKIKRMAAFAKKEVIYFGVAGLVMYLCGTILVDRKNPNQRQKIIEESIERLKRERIKIWVYPEGTRNKERKVKLLPFRKGAFTMAVAAQVPIIPIVFSPSYFVDEQKNIFYNGGKIIMRCLPPVPTTGLTMEDVPQLQQRLYNLILNKYEELWKDVINNIPASLLYTSDAIVGK